MKQRFHLPRRKIGVQTRRNRHGEGGRRVTVRRPRVRDDEGEVELPSWRELADDDPLTERATEQMLIGVSTRKYARSLESVPEGVKTSGTSRSPVSRRFKAATESSLRECWKGI